jgi:hypothetical protein
LKKNGERERRQAKVKSLKKETVEIESLRSLEKVKDLGRRLEKVEN